MTTEAIKPTEAQTLIEKLVETKGDIDNMCVVFSLKGKPGVIAGYTGSSATMWVLGALDHVRWQVYNALTSHKQAREQEELMALIEAASVKPEGKLN